MEGRGEPYLGIDDVLFMKVFYGFCGYALKVLLCLHDRGCVLEGLKIQRKAFLPATSYEPVPEFSLIIRWEFYSLFFCKLDNRADSQAAVQVVMQLDFRDALNHITCDHVLIIAYECQMDKNFHKELIFLTNRF